MSTPKTDRDMIFFLKSDSCHRKKWRMHHYFKKNYLKYIEHTYESKLYIKLRRKL